MLSMHTDTLLKIFESQLQETSDIRERSGDFIRKIVSIYTLQLLQTGNIPHDFFEDVMADIEIEAIEIYRKKTYGFLTLEDYRKHKFKQKNDN